MMEKKLFDLIAAALSAITLLTAWGIWLDDRRKRRRENQPATPTLSGNNADFHREIDDLRNEVNDLRRDVNFLQRTVDRLKDAVRTHRTKIRALLERLSDNTF